MISFPQIILVCISWKSVEEDNCSSWGSPNGLGCSVAAMVFVLTTSLLLWVETTLEEARDKSLGAGPYLPILKLRSLALSGINVRLQQCPSFIILLVLSLGTWTALLYVV